MYLCPHVYIINTLTRFSYMRQKKFFKCVGPRTELYRKTHLIFLVKAEKNVLNSKISFMLITQWATQYTTCTQFVDSIKNCKPNEQVIAGLWALAITLQKCSSEAIYTLSVVDLLIPALLLSVLSSVSLWDLQNQW